MVQVVIMDSVKHPVRLGFAQNLFEKGSINGGKLQHSWKLILDKDHPAIRDIEAAEAAVAKDKWGAKADAQLKAIRLSDNGVIHDGDKKPEWDGFEGKFYINTNTDKRPTILDRDRTPLVQADGKPYSGCYVVGIIDVWAQDNGYGKKINATGTGVQFSRDGDSFAAGAAPADAEAFPDLGVAEDENDPLLD